MKDITFHLYVFVGYKCLLLHEYYCVQAQNDFKITLNVHSKIMEKIELALTHSEQRPQIFISKRKSTCIVSSNWQHKFLYFHYKSVKLDVLCGQN